MLRYAILGSGSSANSYIFEYGDFSFVIDNGFSCREFLRRAEEFSFDPGKIQFIFVTHTHGDHLKGVEVLSRKLKIPVVRHHKLGLSGYVKGRLHHELSVVPGQEYRFRDLVFTPFSTSHDAPFSLSYHFSLGGVTFTLITDTGIVTEEMISHAFVSDVIFLEANYAEDMLRSGPYPEYLKRRILSEKGHLSNDDAISLLNTLSGLPGCRLRLAYLCHLSDTNNDPARLETDLASGLSWDGSYLVCRKSAMQSGLDPFLFEPYVKGEEAEYENEKDEIRT